MTEALPVTIFALCLLACVICAFLLLRGYARGGARLLLWTGGCFVLLSANNLLVILDIVVFPSLELQGWRHAASLAAVTVLLVGLVWESE
ncbi:MAG TPA: DUF5985 family protein [Devosia sp.]